jgi:hypothetical protein
MGHNMKNIVGLISLIAVLFVSSQTQAEEFNSSALYYGGGFGSNSIGSGFDDATGYQIFAGYNFDYKLSANNNLSVEVGYMSTGDFDFGNPLLPGGTFSFSADGLWSTATSTWELNKEVYALARLGLDLGDDDGLMIGGGIGYKVNKEFDFRLEYVVRDTIDSLQFNVVYHP